MAKQAVPIIEVAICIMLYTLYFTNLDDPLFQDSIVVNIAKVLSILGLLGFIFLRIRNIAWKNKGIPLKRLIEASYTLLLILAVSFCLFDFFLLKERFYFSNNSSKFERLVELAAENSCIPSIGDYCEGFVSLPMEFHYWTGHERMLVIRQSGNMYIMLGHKDSNGFVYMSDHMHPPQYLGVGHFDVNCSTEMLENWFVCTVVV